jgi:hypothetical protein
MSWAGALTALALTGACGDNLGPAESPDAMPVEEGPLYAIATTQFLPDGTTTLVALVENPAASATLDASRALEVGGAAAVFGSTGQGVLAVGSSESPVLTRYEITTDGRFVAGDRLSLANTGVTSAFKRQGLVPFLSETKAYWLDDVTQQVIVWNPDAMTIEGSFSLEAAARDELVFELGERAVVRDDGLMFVGARYRTANEGEAGRAVALVIDTESDELVEVLEDPRCGDTVHVVADESGTLYFGSGAVAAVLYALQRPADYPAPCLLRILPGERRFDPDFKITIPDLVESRSAGRLVAGKDGRAYVLALHEEYLDAELGETTEIWEPWDATAWRWWHFELGTDAPATSVDSAPLASAAGSVLHAGGQDYITHLRLEDGATTLLVAGEDGSLTPGLEAPGLPYGLLQVR